jgi:hypothetical protein
MGCAECKAALSRESSDLAEEMQNLFPACECEQYSVGENSPGRIEDHEVLYRMFTDPVDVDGGKLARAAFKTAYIDGLSIIRDCADNAQVEALVTEILSIKEGKPPRKILAIFKFICATVRRETVSANGAEARAFCVYDQTIPRVFQLSEPPVETHGIVLSTGLFQPPKTRKQFQRDCEFLLHKLIAADPISVDEFRNGLIANLNERSLRGEFVRA